MDCLPGSSVHGISQARKLEWVAIPSSGELPDPGMETTSPALAGDSLPLSHQESPLVSVVLSVKNRKSTKKGSGSASHLYDLCYPLLLSRGTTCVWVLLTRTSYIMCGTSFSGIENFKMATAENETKPVHVGLHKLLACAWGQPCCSLD